MNVENANVKVFSEAQVRPRSKNRLIRAVAKWENAILFGHPAIEPRAKPQLFRNIAKAAQESTLTE